jgi:hypothetical protein
MFVTELSALLSTTLVTSKQQSFILRIGSLVRMPLSCLLFQKQHLF